MFNNSWYVILVLNSNKIVLVHLTLFIVTSEHVRSMQLSCPKHTTLFEIDTFWSRAKCHNMKVPKVRLSAPQRVNMQHGFWISYQKTKHIWFIPNIVVNYTFILHAFAIASTSNFPSCFLSFLFSKVSFTRHGFD